MGLVWDNVRKMWTGNPPGGDGGSQPTSNTYYGNPLLINNANAGNLPVNWPTAQGDAVLDLTTPAAPKFVAAGAYIVTIQLSPQDAMTPGGSYNATINFPDSPLTDLLPQGQADAQISAANTNPAVTVTMPYLAAAGDSFSVSVTNLDGVQNINFGIGCVTVLKVA